MRGLGAEKIDFVEETLKLTDKNNCDPLLLNDLNITRQAEQDFDRLIWRLKKSTKRKASPSWSVPAELLLLALEPDFFSVADDKLNGGRAYSHRCS